MNNESAFINTPAIGRMEAWVVKNWPILVTTQDEELATDLRHHCREQDALVRELADALRRFSQEADGDCPRFGPHDESTCNLPDQRACAYAQADAVLARVKAGGTQ